MLSFILILITYAVFFVVCVLRYTVYHLTVNLQISGFSQILFNLQISQEDSNASVWVDAISGFFNMYGTEILMATFLCIIGCAISLYYWKKKRNSAKEFVPFHNRTHRAVLAVSAAMFAISSLGLGYTVHASLNDLGYYKYKEQMANTDTSWFETNYVDPADVNITFEGEKKNLIYIFMESMEVSFADTEHGGGYENVNYIPHLTTLALENNDFGDGQTLNGAWTTTNATWTVAAMVTQTSGTPLMYFNDDFHSFSSDVQFLPDTVMIGDVLEAEGYNNYLLLGSKGTYAARANYFSQHGNYKVMDYAWANENHLLPEDDYWVWWGYEDMYLYEYAKDQILEAASQDEPFNFTMLTVDTHFADGYVCSLCEDTYDWSMENVITCADHQIYDFLEWLSQQDFWEDTVVVIAGDHNSMDTRLGQELANYDRRVYFNVINGPEYDGKVRQYTTLDCFPTTLAAMGATIEGNRLGLGVNLYSSQPTLREMEDMATLNENIQKSCKFFNQEFVDGSGHLINDDTPADEGSGSEAGE